MAHGERGTAAAHHDSPAAGTTASTRSRTLRAAVLMAGVGLLASGCADYSGSLQHLTGTNTEFCVQAADYDAVGAVLPLHLAQDEDALTITAIEPLNAVDAELGEKLLVPTVAEGVAGYGEFGPSLVAEGRGDWDAATDAEGATLEPGQNASLVIETRPEGDGEAEVAGYRLTYTQEGHEHTITVRQAVEIVSEGACKPSEGGGDGRATSDDGGE